MPELGLEAFFRHTGLPLYLAVLLVAFLVAVELAALCGLYASFKAAGVLAFQGVAVFGFAAVLPVFGLGFCLKVIAAAGVQADRQTSTADLHRFAQVVALHDPEGVPPNGERTYLDLACYAAALRRRLAVAEQGRLDLAREILSGR
ncbi:hypothetical protein AS149_12370 [Burkholderia cenocepacia]|nr:hypothetical protein AS149_12370 [Burkholderia cenocepacia]